MLPEMSQREGGLRSVFNAYQLLSCTKRTCHLQYGLQKWLRLLTRWPVKPGRVRSLVRS